MRIKEILTQHRRDFTAVFICEHCSHEYTKKGYDDTNFHENVIPSFECDQCGKKATSDYQPLKTRYPDGYQI